MNRLEKLKTLMVSALFVLVLFAACVINLQTTPPPWWDEGWTLSVARNWVERGFYGRLLDGAPAPNGLEASFPTTGLVALSFELFGVGVWQGRWVSVVCMTVAATLLYFLAHQLYNRSVAVATLAVALFLAPSYEMSPAWLGRQVLAEAPMLLYLLAGYAGLLLALRKSIWFVLSAILFWTIGINSKVQAMPFWAVSLIAPLVIALVWRRWRTVVVLALSLIGPWLASDWYGAFQQFLLQGRTLPTMPLNGLLNVTALVPLLSIRASVLITALAIGIPTLCGLGYATWHRLSNGLRRAPDELEIVRWIMLTLAGSWFAWYVLLSVGWVRYVFPATFIASMFVAKFLYDVTAQFNWAITIQRGGAALRYLRFNRANVSALTAIIIGAMVIVSLTQLVKLYGKADDSAYRVADFVNTHTAPNALIETYETEMLFLLNRRYHYPPDQTNVIMIQRGDLGLNVPYTYDWQSIPSDYLIVGNFGRKAQLYDDALDNPAFNLIYSAGLYDVYARVAPGNQR